jgi:hypothetical protein
MQKQNQDQSVQPYARPRDSITQHTHGSIQDSIALNKGLRTSHQLSSNQLNKSNSSTANSIVQEYKTYSKNFFSKQTQINHSNGHSSGVIQPQIIANIQQNTSVMAQFNNKENVEMRAQSNGHLNGSRGTYSGTQSQIS